MNDLDSRVSTLLKGLPGVTVIQKRNHISVTCNDKVFAYSRQIGLVIKLPRSRVDEIEEAGEGIRLAMGSKEMSEWAVVAVPEDGDLGHLGSLLDESLAFVCGS